jgi:hypothetical protein
VVSGVYDSCRRATKVTFSGRGESRERVTAEWRALDVESIDMQKRASVWAVDVRDGDLDVKIISSDRHCACLTIRCGGNVDK